MTSKLISPGSFFAALVPVVLAFVGASPAHAQPGPDPAAPQDPYDPDDDADDVDQAAPDQAAPYTDDADGDGLAPTEPPIQQPMTQPPPPPANPPPAVQAAPRAAAQPAQPPASGQWVYTQQRGWLWMPYGDQYVYAPPSTDGSAYPMEYVYAPRYGWTWIDAPWVYGWGPRVYFSIGSPVRFGWFHRHGFGHRVVRGPIFRGGFRGGHGGRGHVIRGGHFGRGHFSGGRGSHGGHSGRRH